MLRWALIFFLISVVAGLLGFTGISVGAAEVARLLFTITIVLFLIFLIAGLAAGKTLLKR